MPRRILPSAAIALSFGLAACDSTRPRGPGSIFISSSASTPEPGSGFFQYDIIVDDGSPRSVFVFERVEHMVNGLAPGDHEVRLGGVPVNCNVGENPRSVKLRGEDTALVIFEIKCPRTTGDLEITIATTGPDQDINGYLLRLGNLGTVASLPANISTTLRFLPGGSYAATLEDLAPNCTYGGAQNVTITPGLSASLSFTVTCVALARIRVVSTTTGADADVDGFTLIVNSGVPARVVPNGTTTVAVGNGTVSWQLADVQPNCTVSGATSGTVTLGPGEETTVTVDATCTPIGFGTAGTSAEDAAADTLANANQNANAAHDLLQVTSRYDANWLFLVWRFTRPVGNPGVSAADLFGVIDLDVDENASTGAPPLINEWGGNASQGSDYRILLSQEDGGLVLLKAGDFNFTGGLPFVIEGDSLIIRIPLEKLGGDDGRLSITGVFGTQDRPTDIAPNTGVILARPSASLLAGASAIRVQGRATIRKPANAQWPPTGSAYAQP